jgi:8-oxo-dGTP diphosphatase
MLSHRLKLPRDMERPAYFIAVALLRRANLWLVSRRKEDAHLGGYWEFPGGKIERGESAESAAVRELQEECAVRAEAIRALAAVRHEYDDRVVEIVPVLCGWLSGEPRAISGSACRWVSGEELARLPMPPANQAVIRLALASAV